MHSFSTIYEPVYNTLSHKLLLQCFYGSQSFFEYIQDPRVWRLTFRTFSFSPFLFSLKHPLIYKKNKKTSLQFYFEFSNNFLFLRNHNEEFKSHSWKIHMWRLNHIHWKNSLSLWEAEYKDKQLYAQNKDDKLQFQNWHSIMVHSPGFKVDLYQWHCFIETNHLLPQQLIAFSYGWEFECQKWTDF